MGAPVKNTCPDIDRVIKRIKAALRIATDGRQRYEKGTDEHADFDSIEDELMFIEGDLEDLRSDNAALRDWGHESEEKIDALESKISDLENEIEELKSVTQ